MRTSLVVAFVLFVAAGSALARPAMTRSKARQIAHAANLTADDMQGYADQGSDRTPGEDLWGGKVYARCSGRKGLGKALADVNASFERDTSGTVDGIESEVEVMPKASYVKQDLALAGTAKGRACVLKQLRASSSQSPNAQLLSARATKLVPAVAHGVGIHLELTIRANGSDVHFVSDLLVVGDKTAEAAIFAGSTGAEHPRADEDRLLGIVQTRLRAQLHPNDTII